MNILRGSFRLSLVITAAVFLYGVWTAFLKADEAARTTYELWTTLRCGERLLKQDLSAHMNEYGNFDLGKLGCAHRTFWANKTEIETALNQTDPSRARRSEELNWQLQLVGGSTLATFVGVNLLGVLALGLLQVARWVRNGFAR
jgi:hypothetical protein